MTESEEKQFSQIALSKEDTRHGPPRLAQRIHPLNLGAGAMQQAGLTGTGSTLISLTDLFNIHFSMLLLFPISCDNAIFVYMIDCICAMQINDYA